jgi:hypothetical protein
MTQDDNLCRKHTMPPILRVWHLGAFELNVYSPAILSVFLLASYKACSNLCQTCSNILLLMLRARISRALVKNVRATRAAL